VDPQVTLATGAVALTGAVTFRYLMLCWIRPFRHCRKCDGRGRLATPLGRLTRQCRRCRGTGLRLRIGRHVINHFRRTRADAHRPTRTTDATRPPVGAPWR
jgi:hypothetical protein